MGTPIILPKCRMFGELDINIIVGGSEYGIHNFLRRKKTLKKPKVCKNSMYTNLEISIMWAA